MRKSSRPTIVDVARIAGVSPTTVSYVLSGPTERANRISEDTTARVLNVVREVGYVPNQSARTLRLRRTNRVLFLANRITSLYSQTMAISIEQGLSQRGYAPSVQIGAGSDHIQRAITMLDQHQADGLVVETDDQHLPALRAAAENGHAIVAIGPSAAEPSFDVMSNDDTPAIHDAMSHVAARGYRQVVLMSMRPEPPLEYRIDVALRQLKALGYSDDEITMVHCPHDRGMAYHSALEFLHGQKQPMAVYSGSDVSAIGVLWACLQLGRNVPAEVGIIGHGNSPETHITVPPLTSLGPVNSDFSKAAELMASRLNDRDLPGRHISEPCQFSIRDSC